MIERTAAVIGSGFGGLALAIRLQSAGIRTTLFEALDEPGGRAGRFEAQGFRFDMGPSVVTDPTCLEELFALSGRSMADYAPMLPVAPFYRLLWEDGSRFDYSNDEAALLAQIAARNSSDVEGYRRFMEYSAAVLAAGYQNLGHVAFLDFRSMLAAGPKLLRHQAWRSVWSKLSSFIEDPQLREAFSFHTLLVGGNPFTASSIYALIHALERKWGVWFPKGGTQALVDALVRLFTDLGGELLLGTPVAAIEAAGSHVLGVATADGRTRRFDAIASNADVMHSYRDLLAGHPRGAQAAAALERKRWSPSLFVLYFGLKRAHPDIPQHSILFGPRYRGLLHDIYETGALAPDFSLYLHHPTATDPDLAPEGCSAFYALAPVPHLGKLPVDWSQIAPAYADRILDALERRLIPGLRSDLVMTRIFTPDDFRTRLSAHLGSAFSLEPLLLQSAWFRTHNRDDRLGNLYFVGAGTHPGAGIPGVVGSAKATARLMLADLAGRA
jgi:phytoene desaturase